ncbi:hypothetical protein B0J13DRAFT_680061 [Dactylonectria estremocensis]|uniref:Uncharacterized protein n=1 Tax=Dactylonectria estremocensis TaxID=1079267 RepID=A0A9P9DQE0_9HYPO|nr:hypothetical protein B0J13DRAFT_680061 [Dactylonectria estremocensis]
MELIHKLGDWLREHEGKVFKGGGEEPPSDGSIQTTTRFIEWLGFPLRKQNWPALWRFLERSYWARVWITQQFAVPGRFAKASGIFYCGATQFARTQFDCFCVLILLMVIETSMPINVHPPGLAMFQTLAGCISGENRNIDWLLRVTARSKATDPRDKLYALLGMAEDGDILKPDYSASYGQVLISFVSSHIERYHSQECCWATSTDKYRQALLGSGVT